MVDKGMFDSLVQEQKQWQQTSAALDQVRSRAERVQGFMV
jgi:hypothetical protein